MRGAAEAGGRWDTPGQAPSTPQREAVADPGQGANTGGQKKAAGKQPWAVSILGLLQAAGPKEWGPEGGLAKEPRASGLSQ